MHSLRTCLALFLFAAVAGCHSSPTEPSRSYALIGSGTFASADNTATILGFHMSLDGQDTISATPTLFAAPQSQILFNTENFGPRHGHHTLELRVTSQTVSPTTYRTTGITMSLYDVTDNFINGKLVATVQLPDQAASLNTGDTMRIGFDI